MPLKRRGEKARKAGISAEAVARWTQTHGIDGHVITDETLAALLGRLPLVAYPDAPELQRQLSNLETAIC